MKKYSLIYILLFSVSLFACHEDEGTAPFMVADELFIQGTSTVKPGEQGIIYTITGGAQTSGHRLDETYSWTITGDENSVTSSAKTDYLPAGKNATVNFGTIPGEYILTVTAEKNQWTGSKLIKVSN
ncbi:MAG: hypothetical protein ACNS62_06245 [Candidatus Cyclobacteriaceae bacterium M3_2C_046]